MSKVMKDALEKAGVRGSTKKGRKVKNVSTAVRGRIKWFDLRKNHGFVVAEDGSEIFLHSKSIVSGRSYLGYDAGDEITFRKEMDPNTGKVWAVNAQLVTDADKSESADDQPV